MLAVYSLTLAMTACAGTIQSVVSPDKEKAISFNEYAPSATIQIGKEQLVVAPPAHLEPGMRKPYAFVLRSAAWAPDSSKVLMIGEYDASMRLYAVYDLTKRKLLYYEPGEHFLSWLPDSKSYLAHDVSEGIIDAPKSGGLHKITLYRIPFSKSARRSVLGSILWSGPKGKSAALHRIEARDNGRKVYVEVDGEGPTITGEVKSEGKHTLTRYF